ncbi:Aste57867_3417 [Aphanomyces stellatus]|uniref:Aste57867_3417 protein n=1 Tax=Aphanomyces stellatus TaxID=120398 RepID=A0A485KAP7_9STRA|nr:hypothetical protein As57867_003407 [Aphanomyces stellatus]VFT80583.1 Aste57867_3417 [Aphanomyces stellatus]
MLYTSMGATAVAALLLVMGYFISQDGFLASSGHVPPPILLPNVDADTNRRCHLAHNDFLAMLTPGRYTNSSFFACFRTSAQIVEFVRALVAQNPHVLTTTAIATTTSGAPILGYTLSTDPTAHANRTLYIQSLLHGREWVAGSSLLFTLASLLDAMAVGESTIADTFDLLFVPLVNVDGYDLSWTTDRDHRKNANNVDLNRNWPTPFVDPNPPPPTDEAYAGPMALSEVETSSLHRYLLAHQHKMLGYLDIHACLGTILYAFGDTHAPLGHGDDQKYHVLAYAIQLAMGLDTYDAEPVWHVYDAFGGFTDFTFRTFHKPSITIEVAGDDFAVPATDIRRRGQEVLAGVVAFANGVDEFNRPTNETRWDSSGGLRSAISSTTNQGATWGWLVVAGVVGTGWL